MFFYTNLNYKIELKWCFGNLKKSGVSG